METLKFRKGDMIFEEGDLEDWMHEIREGMVGIYAGYGTPAEKELPSRRGPSLESSASSRETKDPHPSRPLRTRRF